MIRIALSQDSEAKEYSIKRFEELFDLRYSPHLEFANWEVEQAVRKDAAKALKKGRVGQLALWLGKLHGKEIEEKIIPDIAIRWIGAEIGYGAFASKSYKKWEYIGTYSGLLRERRLFFSDINDYCFMYPSSFFSLKRYTIDCKLHGTATRFINHSDTPNCESVAVFHDGIYHIIFRATEEIPNGKELTYDYGDVYWLRRKKLPEVSIENLIDPEDLKKLKTDAIGGN